LSSPDDADIIPGTRIVPARHDRADDGAASARFVSRESVEKNTGGQPAP
jgi:hypothetical protein